MQKETLTEDLLERLRMSTTLEAFLREDETIDRTLAEYLSELLVRLGITRAELVRRSGVNGTFVYDIFEGKSKPSRDNAIMLALALECDLAETQRLLRLAGVADLWPKVRRDAIIIWCINHEMSRVACDDELNRLHEQTLFKPDGARAKTVGGTKRAGGAKLAVDAGPSVGAQSTGTAHSLPGCQGAKS